MSDYQVSDDDDSFEEELPCSQNNTSAKLKKKNESGSSDVILISEDDQERLIDEASTEIELLGLHQEGSEFISQQRLFSAPSSRYDGNIETVEISDDESLITDDSMLEKSDAKDNTSETPVIEDKVKVEPSVNKSVDVRYISGVEVHFPVKPYSSQISIMSKVITGITKEQNCLLESPTGSGKTLALLCAALAWQQKQIDMSSKITSDRMRSSLGLIPPTESASPVKETKSEAEDTFSRRTFGHSSIYDEANGGNCRVVGQKSERRQSWGTENNENKNLVTIHKRQKTQQSDGLNPGYSELVSKEVSAAKDEQLPGCSSPKKDQQFRTSSPVTPTKCGIETVVPDTPESVRNVNTLMRLLTFELLVDSRVPVIYYGARTHKQLQQVIKELKRTAYADTVTMSVLSSREHSCIHPLDRSKYDNKTDMCSSLRAPDKEAQSETQPIQAAVKKKCRYFEEVDRLRSSQALPRIWDLEDLVTSARRLDACAYYAARRRATTARLVFCPYNYLIDPNIRSSLSINLRGQIVILDEAHNIEDVCREIATVTMPKDDFLKAITEMELLQRYDTRYLAESAGGIINMLKNFVDWFDNNQALLEEKPISSSEVAHTWRPADFVQTLTNHNIGLQQYPAFRRAANDIVSILKESPKELYMVTTPTGTLLETLNTTLGYLFGEECRYMDDFKPALVKTVGSASEPLPNSMGWRSTYSTQRSQKPSYALRLMCMNPGVIFASLRASRCIVLSSGTLAPIVSLSSELQTHFPLQLAAKHVIPADRVWVGSIATCPKGRQLSCTYKNMGAEFMLDGLGDILLWVCQVTPNGVLCFLPSYRLMDNLYRKWELSGLWEKLKREKSVFMESRTMKDHEAIMTEFYSCVGGPKGALLIAVYRGKVSEGMDFKDQQARAVVTVGIPFPNLTDIVVKSKMEYNDARRKKDLLSGSEWMRVQAYRALNQAVGRCVRHRGDWGAVLMVDSRFSDRHNTQYLSQWVQNFLGDNHHSWASLTGSDDRALDSFMRRMTLQDELDQHEMDQHG